MLDDTVLDESVALAEGRSARIGPYKLLEKIGEGGFGVVFLAEQEAPVVRRVALKVIKLGMDTREVVARFEQERQALAMMEHPNIAKVFDAGATGTGRPYFVMELVRGDPITRYCDTSRSSMRDRLALFVHVCHAVQHAHQKGIIHRDLKPSNVLVTLQDGAPVPKVIDFGIAKATRTRLTEKTLFTEHGQLIGTPEYMSPEQAEMSGVDIDTRSDIYSLGVLLYELLTGTTPFDREKLRSASYAELQRIIREVDPPRPSTRLSTIKDALQKVAAQRHTEPRRLCASVRGDLDWIVMKCIEKDRTRRYEAANGLAQDIQRHLDGEPVVAAPPSASYRMRKFIQRHRAGVIAGAAMGALIVFGTVGTTAGMIRALREKTRADESAAQARAAAEAEIQARALAEENEKRAREQSEIAARETARARVAEEEAKARAGELEQVARFQAETLAQVDPTQAGILLTQDVHERLEAALAKAGVPATERTVRVESFRVHWRDINATDTARHLIDRTILSPAAEAIDRQFTDQPLVRARLEQALADRYRELGLYEAAMPLQASALEIRRRILGADHPDTLGSVNNMGLLLQAGEKLVEAEACYREALDGLRRVRGEDHPDTLAAMNNVGFLLRYEGRLDEAEPVFRDTLARLRRVLGNEDPGTLTSVCNMGYVLQEQGRPDEAAPLFREALDGRRRVLGDKHPDTLTSITNMGGLYMSQRRFAEAEPYIREALEKHRSVLGEEHPYTIASLENLGGLLWEQGKLAEAEQCFREALEKRRSLFGDSHPDTLATMNVVASLLETRGKMDEALTYRRAMLASLRSQPGMSGAPLASALAKFGDSLLTHAAHHEASAVEAEVVLRECTELRRVIYPDGNEAQWLKHNALSLLGKALALQRRFAEAEPLLIEAYERMKDDPRVPSAAVAGTDRRRDALVRIVELYEAWDAAEPATRPQRAGKAAEWRERLTAFDAAAAKN